jgi:hypothetical protein
MYVVVVSLRTDRSSRWVSERRQGAMAVAQLMRTSRVKGRTLNLFLNGDGRRQSDRKGSAPSARSRSRPLRSKLPQRTGY